MRQTIVRNRFDVGSSVLLDAPSEQASSWDLGWIGPWQCRQFIRAQSEGVGESTRQSFSLWLDRFGWHVSRVRVHTSELDSLPHSTGALSLANCMLRGSSKLSQWRRATSCHLIYFAVDGGWRFAVYRGVHLIYSRFLEAAQCDTQEAASGEAQSLIDALQQRGAARVTHTEVWTSERAWQAGQRYANRFWHSRLWLRRPHAWTAPRQWLRRGAMLVLWCALPLSGLSILNRWHPPESDTLRPRPELSAIADLALYRNRWRGQKTLDQRSQVLLEPWLRQLGQWQSGSIRLSELSWQQRHRRWQFHWAGEAGSEQDFKHYRKQVSAERLHELLPTQQAQLHWQRLSAAPALTLNSDESSAGMLRWRAQWEGR